MNIEKRYGVFIFLKEHPSGGWDDFWGWYYTLEKAEKEIDNIVKNLSRIEKLHWQIIDLAVGDVVQERKS